MLTLVRFPCGPAQMAPWKKAKTTSTTPSKKKGNEKENTPNVKLVQDDDVSTELDKAYLGSFVIDI